jgi:hypothetical protein
MTSIVICEVVLNCNGRGWDMYEEENVGLVGCISKKWMHFVKKKKKLDAEQLL